MSIETDVRALATEYGRAVGTEGHMAAKNYILERLNTLDVVPYLSSGFELVYERSGQSFCNLIAKVPGLDQSLNPILLGAHYDTCSDLPGADDNAAAVAVLLEAAAKTAQERPDRTVVFALFDAEEPPHFLMPSMGSIRFYEDQRVTDFHCAIIMDLVGHDVPLPGLEDLLFVMGMESDQGLGDAVGVCPEDPSVRVLPTLSRYVGDMSDHHVFRVNEIPYLFLSCGTWDHYHQATDTPEKLNYTKIAGVSRYLMALTNTISVQPLLGPFEGYDSTDIEKPYIKKVLYPVMAAMGMPLNVEGRRDIDRLVNMLVTQIGV